MMKAERLKPKDTVGIIAPAGYLRPEKLQKGIKFLEELDLQVKLGAHLFKQDGYLAGNDLERLEDLHQMFADEEVKAIFCARGGYGSARIASMIDFELIQENPKIFMGYSDISFLHLAITKKTGLVTFHGPMIASDFGKDGIAPYTSEFFQQLFDSKPVQITNGHSILESLIDGVAFGPLTGGNLTLITSTLGTEFEIDTNGKILLLEEINEEPRAIDRMLNQLEMAGKLHATSGIIFADFHDCISKADVTFELDEILEHYAKRAKKPALKGVKIGHCSPNLAVPLGVNAILDTRKKQFIVESGVL